MMNQEKRIAALEAQLKADGNDKGPRKGPKLKTQDRRKKRPEKGKKTTASGSKSGKK